MATASESSQSDERTFLRMPYDSTIKIICQGGVSGQAQSEDVGRGGFRLRLQRYLRPGHRLMIRTDTGEELKGQVVWCRPDRDATRFVAGIRVVHDEAAAYETMGKLLFDAVRKSAEPKRPTIQWRRPSVPQYSAAGMGLAAAAAVAIQHIGH